MADLKLRLLCQSGLLKTCRICLIMLVSAATLFGCRQEEPDIPAEPKLVTRRVLWNYPGKGLYREVPEKLNLKLTVQSETDASLNRTQELKVGDSFDFGEIQYMDYGKDSPKTQVELGKALAELEAKISGIIYESTKCVWYTHYDTASIYTYPLLEQQMYFKPEIYFLEDDNVVFYIDRFSFFAPQASIYIIDSLQMVDYYKPEPLPIYWVNDTEKELVVSIDFCDQFCCYKYDFQNKKVMPGDTLRLAVFYLSTYPPLGDGEFKTCFWGVASLSVNLGGKQYSYYDYGEGEFFDLANYRHPDSSKYIYHVTENSFR